MNNIINIGSICTNEHGRLGIVQDIKKGCCGKSAMYNGMGFDAEPWSTKSATKEADHMNEYIENLLDSFETALDE